MKTSTCLTALALAAMFAAPLRADDAKDDKAIDDAVAEIAVTDDPIFAQYVDLDQLDYAWTFLDAEALADIGIKLADAERILFRSHPAVDSQQVLKIAVRTASVTGAKKALEKLDAYAKKNDRGDMVQQIKLASQLAGKSRSIAPSLSLDDVSIGAFIAYKQAQHDLKAALVIGDIELLKELQERINKYTEKEPAIWTKLNNEINEQVKTMAALGAPSRGGPDDMSGASSALNKLSGASRQWPGPPFGGGSSYGNQSTTNYQYQHGVRVQNPRAAVLGGLLGGIASGLNAKNPQKNAVAVGVLGGLSQGFNTASQPTVWGQGSTQTTNRGWNNNWGPGWGN